jgi:acyl-CoA reductase-like NAD-dependent aldehyde dehydrogenase
VWIRRRSRAGQRRSIEASGRASSLPVGTVTALRQTCAAIAAWLRRTPAASGVDPAAGEQRGRLAEADGHEAASPLAPDASGEGHIDRLQRALARERAAAKVARREAWRLAQQLRQAREELHELRTRDCSDEGLELVAELRAACDEIRRLVGESRQPTGGRLRP